MAAFLFEHSVAQDRMQIRFVTVEHPEKLSIEITDHIRPQLPYFTSTPEGIELAKNEYWFDLPAIKQILDDGSFLVVSPLRAENAAEVELSEEAEQLIEWLLENGVNRVRLES
jgi:hypothetical protein